MGLGIGLNFFAAALLVYRYPSADTAVVAFGVAAAGGGFSLFYGRWVSRIIAQSAERAEIIDQLEATRAELSAAQHEAGRMAERQRLSADIHDTLAQGFTSILMLIQAAQADLDGSHPRAGKHLDLAARTARENLAEARALVADLAPAQLEGATLPDALRRLSQAPGMDASFGSPVLRGSSRWPPRSCCCGCARKRSPTCASTLARTRRPSSSATIRRLSC